MPPEDRLERRFEELRAELERIGAPVWVRRDDHKEIPTVLVPLCPSGSQRSDWVSYIARTDLPSNASLRVAFGWSLLNLDEIVEMRTGGVKYGEDLAADGVADAWLGHWVPILWHNDGVVVVDHADQVSRLWWEADSPTPMGLDPAGLIDLFISLLRAGTYVWDAAFQGFDRPGAGGHPVLDF